MAVSARDVAAVLRERLPGLPTKKLHKLLYYCQGHHLAAFDEPLFTETISAWDMGPVVGTLWRQEKQGEVAPGHVRLDEAQLNTIGYVISRYGALTGLDLENLTHSEQPWQLANRVRRPGESARIESDWIKEYFKAAGTGDDEEDEQLLDSAVVRQWLKDAPARRTGLSRPDNLEYTVTAWILTRYDDPYQGVRRETRYPNLWFGAIPNTGHGLGYVVGCAYWIDESARTVQCDSFATLSLL
jgi:uncharacterized phage-associated protein